MSQNKLTAESADEAIVTRGDDPGCYVQAWVWVYFDDDME